MARAVPPFDQAKAKQLLAQAGVEAGFYMATITPLPPYFSWAERVASQLRAVGIRTNVNQLERATFYEKLAPGPDRLKGSSFSLPALRETRLPACVNMPCNGSFSGLCTDEVDSRMKRYDVSTDDTERQTLLAEAQTYWLDNYRRLG